MKRYTINVHYDCFASVVVEAETQEDALLLAREKANDVPTSELEFTGVTDSCIVNISTDKDDLEELAKLHNQLHNQK